MTDRSAIEWTQATWNPVTGCDRISPACDRGYALTLAKRLKAMGQPHYQTDGHPRTSGPGFGVATHPEALTVPLGWRRPRLIFVNSMSDLSVGVTIEDQMIAAGHHHYPDSALCATSVANGSR
jgi:protein gp37